MTSAQLSRYLKIIGCEMAAPSEAYLRRLMAAHQAAIPYENASKLLRAARGSCHLEPLQEFLENAETDGFGGTCFAQNLNFADLLLALGFEVEVLAVDSGNEIGSHSALRVRLDGKCLWVDLGLMLSGFSGPFDFAQGGREMHRGVQRFRFLPEVDASAYRFEMWRSEKLHRSFQSQAASRKRSDFIGAVEKTFEPQALFMKNLCIYRNEPVFPTDSGAISSNPIGSERSRNLWNRELWSTEGLRSEKRELQNVDELREAIHVELKLPKYPVDEILEVLRARNGVDFFC